MGLQLHPAVSQPSVKQRHFESHQDISSQRMNTLFNIRRAAISASLNHQMSANAHRNQGELLASRHAQCSLSGCLASNPAAGDSNRR